MAEMTVRERVMAAVKGEPVDRVPVSFFGHNRVAERSSDTLVSHLLEIQRKFGWDFVKIQLSPDYYGEAWGCKYLYYPDKPSDVLDYVVKSALDLKRLQKVDPKKGVLCEQVKVAKLLCDELKGEVPMVQTLFNPLLVASRLAGAAWKDTGVIRRLMIENPEELHYGLSIISQTLADYARAALRVGTDGIFITTIPWTRDVVTEEEYEIFGRPYDLAIFEAANQEGATFNVLHICGENIMFDLFSDYPVQVISYDAFPSRNPSLEEAMGRTDKTLWGGINQNTTLLNGPVDSIVAEVQSAIQQTHGRRFILGPGCSIPPHVPDIHLLSAKKALES